MKHEYLEHAKVPISLNKQKETGTQNASNVQKTPNDSQHILSVQTHTQ